MLSEYFEAEKRMTELHSAARNGDFARLQALLEKGEVSIDSVDKHSRTPLHMAAWANKHECVELLVASGSKVDKPAMDNSTPLHFAVSQGSLQAARTLLKMGAGVNIALKKNNRTPLMVAAAKGNADMVALLIKKGANVLAKSGKQETALDVASTPEVRKILAEAREARLQRSTKPHGGGTTTQAEPQSAPITPVESQAQNKRPAEEAPAATPATASPQKEPAPAVEPRPAKKLKPLKGSKVLVNPADAEDEEGDS